MSDEIIIFILSASVHEEYGILKYVWFRDESWYKFMNVKAWKH